MVLYIVHCTGWGKKIGRLYLCYISTSHNGRESCNLYTLAALFLPDLIWPLLVNVVIIRAGKQKGQ